jgi:hypothetical protein
MMPPVSMPGQVVTARVLLFVAGSLWGLFAVSMLLFGLAAGDAMEEVPGFGGAGGAAVGVGFLAFLIFGGLAALHIVPAAMFGKGRIGTRVTAIIAASLNTLIPVLAMFGSIDDTGAPAGTVFMSLLWLATAVLTIVFCSLGQAGYWFNRPQY